MRFDCCTVPVLAFPPRFPLFFCPRFAAKQFLKSRTMFEKTLTDVVKGIRASKRDTALYISQCIAEIKTEINSSDMYVKANALQKLTFLQMMGYSMSWASFATIEVMSSPRFAHKRVGYLAASQGFTQDTEVILLTTNLLKKELRGAVGGGMHGVYEAGLAINCVSNIVTEDLAQDLLPEITNLTQHPQPYLRKKAILCLFKLFVKYPQGLRLTFARLQQCLDDSNQSVVSCAVNVITELSDKNPKNYLHLAPAFFDLLTQSSNNWMLIKVVKLLGSLVPEEPRLARKLLEPLADIVRCTQAKSLQYEAAHAITLCLPYCRKSDGSMPAIVPEIVTLTAQTLRSFVEEADQNLKYLGLVGFGSLIQSHPRVLSSPDYRPLILACLSDQDVTIRRRALDLLKAVASRKNLLELVSQLLNHVEQASGTYKLDLVAKIVEICASDKYALLQDFGWYLDILFRLGHMRDVETHAELLRAQITDVALRVLPVRGYAVRRSIEILLEGDSGSVQGTPHNRDGGDDGRCCDNGRGKHIMPEILPSIAWIIGEYSDSIREALTMGDDGDSDDEGEFFYDDTSKGSYHAIIQALTTPSNTRKLPTTAQKVYVQASMKVLAAATADSVCTKIELEACVLSIRANMAIYFQSTDVEVVERAFTAIELLKSLQLGLNSHSTSTISNGGIDSEEGKQGDDLLGMMNQSQTKTVISSSPSLFGNLKNASSALNYLLKPSPMKPVGAKSQRKKRNSPSGVEVDLDAPADVSIFNDFLKEEEQYRAGSKLTIEAVSFTQQQPLQIEEPAVISISSSTPMVGISSRQPMPGFGSSSVANDASSSFQHPVGVASSAATTNSRQRQGDPFYLDSTPAATANGSLEQREDSRFGTIQLLDSDDDEPAVKRSKKKEKKAKRSKAKKQQDSSLLMFGESSPPDDSKLPPVTMYDSDDDGDDESDNVFAGKRKGPSKEFAGLAKVDLTTPLREDEVMPERKHRVVPERRTEEQNKPTKVKKKTKKKSKKGSSGRQESGGAEAVGDLLGLGSFDLTSAPSAPTPPVPNQALSAPAAQNVNPVNAAFDDLLGFSSDPVPAPVLGSGVGDLTTLSTQGVALTAAPSIQQTSPPASSSKKGGKRPWMRATIKSSSSSGRDVDWSNLSLSYRVYPTSNDGATVSVMIAARVDNKSQSPVTNLTLELKNHGAVGLGTITPGSSAETSKIGPFVYKLLDSSQEWKGKLRSATSEVSVKLALPASVYLSPQENLSLDQVAQEIAAGGWSLDTISVDLTSGLSPERIKSLICGSLRAVEVNGNESPLLGTFSSYSASTGARVRTLVKIKEKSVKIDVRCTNASLGKSLASDCKRLLL